MNLHHLIPDAAGEIRLYHKFWNAPVKVSGGQVVPVILCYSDLMDTMDQDV